MDNLFQDKRGQIIAIPALAAIVVGIVAIFALIFGIAGLLAFITNNSLVVVGVGIIIGFFIVLFQGVQTEFTQTKAIFMIILLATGIFLVFGAGVLQESVGGLTIVSIDSDIGVLSNEEQLNNKFFFINVITGIGNQKIVGTISPNDFKQKSGFETTFPLEIEVTSVDETIDYPIINEREPIYEYNVLRLKDKIFSTPSCPSNSIKTFNFVGTDVYCVVKEQIGVKGRLENPNLEFSSTIDLTVNNEKISKTVSNKDSQATFIDKNGELVATVSQLGGLSTGDSVPDSSAYTAYYFDNAASWNLDTEEDWRQYSEVRNSFESSVSSYTSGSNAIRIPGLPLVNIQISNDEQLSQSLNELTNKIDDKTRLLITSDAKITGLDDQTLTNLESRENAKVRGTLDRRLNNQNLLLKVRASWMGVKIGVGEPDIIDNSLTCELFKSGDQGFIEGRVKNKGSASSTFEMSVNGCSPFQSQFSGFNNQIQVGAGKTEDFNIALTTGSISEEILRTCTITATDVSLSTKKDSASVECSLAVPALCTAGEQKVTGQCIFECNADETGFKELSCCNLTPVFNEDSDQYECPKGAEEIELPKSTDKLVNPINEKDCEFYETFVPAGSETTSFLFFEKTTVTQDQCKVSPLAFLTVFLLIVGLIIILITLLNRGK